MIILQRYIVTEIVRTSAAVMTVLLLTTVGLLLGDTLADVAKGSIPADLLLGQIGLRSLEALTILVPLSVFLASLLALGRMNRDSEMVVMTACGMGQAALFRALSKLIGPLILVMLALGVFLSPWAMRHAKDRVAEATSQVTIAGLQAGRFHTIASHDSVVYVESADPEGRFTHAFVHIDRGGRKDVVTAKSGFQYIDQKSGARYLALLDGVRAEGIPGQADFRIMEFERNDIRVPDSQTSVSESKIQSLALPELLALDGPSKWIELHWRLAPAMAVLALMSLVVPLSRSGPRQGIYGTLVLGILIYVVYANMLGLGRAWLEAGQTPVWLGLIWLPAAAVLIALWLARPRVGKRRRTVQAVG